MKKLINIGLIITSILFGLVLFNSIDMKERERILYGDNDNEIMSMTISNIGSGDTDIKK